MGQGRSAAVEGEVWMKRETPAEKADREAVEYMMADPRSRHFAVKLIIPFLTELSMGEQFQAGRLSVSQQVWGAFVAHARPQLGSLLSEIFRGQSSGRTGARAADTDDG